MVMPTITMTPGIIAIVAEPVMKKTQQQSDAKNAIEKEMNNSFILLDFNGESCYPNALQRPLQELSKSIPHPADVSLQVASSQESCEPQKSYF